MVGYWEINTPYDSAVVPRYHTQHELFQALANFVLDGDGNPILQGRQYEAVVVYHRNDDDEDGIVVLDLDQMEVA